MIFPFVFEIRDAVIDDLDLLLYDGYLFGKAVVLAHLPRELFNFCVRYRLRDLDFLLLKI